MSQFIGKKILIIAAHPDDEVLGCGGTTARLAQGGAEIHTLILGEGATSRDMANRSSLEAVEELKCNAREAGDILGVKKLHYGGLPDNRFDSIPLLEIIKKVEAVKMEIDPDIVFTHHTGDLNVDHEITSRAVVTAFRPVPGSKLSTLYAFEVFSFQSWGEFRADCFVPNCFFNVTEQLPNKEKAFSCYKGELMEFPHPRSIEGVKTLAKYRGAFCGVQAAEAFKILFTVN